MLFPKPIGLLAGFTNETIGYRRVITCASRAVTTTISKLPVWDGFAVAPVDYRKAITILSHAIMRNISELPFWRF